MNTLELLENHSFEVKELTLRMTPYQVNFLCLLIETFVAENPSIFPKDSDDDLYANNDQVMVEGLLVYLQQIFFEKEI